MENLVIGLKWEGKQNDLAVLERYPVASIPVWQNSLANRWCNLGYQIGEKLDVHLMVSVVACFLTRKWNQGSREHKTGSRDFVKNHA